MKIKERIGEFFGNTREIRHKSEALVLMISMYYFITIVLMFTFILFDCRTGIADITLDFLVLGILFIFYIVFLKRDEMLEIWAMDENDLKHWEKRKMTLKIFLVLLIVTTCKGVITTRIMDFIYAIKGIENPPIPGSVRAIGTDPSILIRAIILGPITEELIFREAGLNSFRKNDNKLEAIIFTSIVFGIMHANLPQAINSVIGGLIYGYIAVEFGVLHSILFHVINNAMIYVEYFLNIETMMENFAVIALIIVVITCGRKSVKLLQRYSKENCKYSFKRQILYFAHLTLIMFMLLWILKIIISV